jgi:hypothetical protein
VGARKGLADCQVIPSQVSLGDSGEGHVNVDVRDCLDAPPEVTSAAIPPRPLAMDRATRS